MLQGWMSPNFGPTGCIGAIVWWLVMVLAIGGLLYMAITLARPWM